MRSRSWLCGVLFSVVYSQVGFAQLSTQVFSQETEYSLRFQAHEEGIFAPAFPSPRKREYSEKAKLKLHIAPGGFSELEVPTHLFEGGLCKFRDGMPESVRLSGTQMFELPDDLLTKVRRTTFMVRLDYYRPETGEFAATAVCSWSYVGGGGTGSVEWILKGQPYVADSVIGLEPKPACMELDRDREFERLPSNIDLHSKFCVRDLRLQETANEISLTGEVEYIRELRSSPRWPTNSNHRFTFQVNGKRDCRYCNWPLMVINESDGSSWSVHSWRKEIVVELFGDLPDLQIRVRGAFDQPKGIGRVPLNYK